MHHWPDAIRALLQVRQQLADAAEGAAAADSDVLTALVSSNAVSREAIRAALTASEAAPAEEGEAAAE